MHNAKSLQEISMPTTGSFHSLDGLTSNKNTASTEETIEMLQFLVKQLQDRISNRELELKKIKDQLILSEARDKEEIVKLEIQLKNIENRNKEINERNEELYQRLKTTEEAKIESEIRAQKNLDEKREIRSLLEEKDRRLADLEMKLSTKCKELSELEDKRDLEQSEWKQFQQDLLTTVRVANDFKHEVMADYKTLLNEKNMIEEKLLLVESELQKYKKNSENKKLQFTLRSNGNNDANNASNTNGSVTTPPLSKMCSSDMPVSVATVKPISKSIQSPKTSSLLTLIQNYEPNTANSQLHNTNTGRTTLMRSNSGQLSVRSLIESIESNSKTSTVQQSSPQQLNSPTQTSPSSPSGPLCNRSNSVPLIGNGTSPHELIQRHLRQQAALTESSTPGSSSITTPNNELRSSLSTKNGTQTNTVFQSVILKDNNKTGDKSTYMSDILNNKIESIRPRAMFRFVYHLIF